MDQLGIRKQWFDKLTMSGSGADTTSGLWCSPDRDKNKKSLRGRARSDDVETLDEVGGGGQLSPQTNPYLPTRH